MNKEMIKEIAKRSGFYFHNAGHFPIEHTLPKEYSEECFNRFAESIIKECGKYLDSPEFIGRSDLDWSIILNEHFGIK